MATRKRRRRPRGKTVTKTSRKATRHRIKTCRTTCTTKRR